MVTAVLIFFAADFILVQNHKIVPGRKCKIIPLERFLFCAIINLAAIRTERIRSIGTYPEQHCGKNFFACEVAPIKKYKIPLLLWVVFEAVAVALWLSLGKLFYLLNFTYIGTAIAVGLALYIKGYRYARMAVQLAVGLYMLVYLGVISHENMQIAGFWYYLFLGVFQAAVIHYLVAKIAGPFLFGRGWCGYACWTAMVLDFLPYKTPQKPRREKLGWLRVVVFAASFIYVFALSRLYPSQMENLMFISFIGGNVLYYAAGIVLAFAFKDNRAFCKYICPITVFLKPASYYARLRIQVDTDACISCGKCKKACPMDVDMLDNRRSRKNGTECILCFACKRACPVHAIK